MPRIVPLSNINGVSGAGGSGTGQNDIVDFYQEHCVYLPAMLGWFFFSSLLSSYNKYVFGDGHMAFPCPLLLTSVHFSIQWAVSYWVCELFPVSLGTERVQRMSNSEWAKVSIPCGMVTALDVGLSNWSLKFITLTFYTMVKSSTPIFVLGWAYIFGIERITWPLIGVICVIAFGEFLTVVGEVDFVLKGFITCLTASILSGARWTLVQLKLQTMDPPLKSTLVTMRLLSPSMFWSMLLLSFIIEQPWNKFGDTGDGEEHGGSFQDIEKIFFLGAVGGLLAVAMVLCEFYLILNSTAMVLMIGGVIKELTTILIGVLHFGDKLNHQNIAGICVVFTGVVLYKMVFHLEKSEARDDERKNGAGPGGRDNVVGKLMDGGGGGAYSGIDQDDNDNTMTDALNDSKDDAVAFSPRSVELVDRSNGKQTPKGGFAKMTTETISNDKTMVVSEGEDALDTEKLQLV